MNIFCMERPASDVWALGCVLYELCNDGAHRVRGQVAARARDEHPQRALHPAEPREVRSRRPRASDVVARARAGATAERGRRVAVARGARVSDKTGDEGGERDSRSRRRRRSRRGRGAWMFSRVVVEGGGAAGAGRARDPRDGAGGASERPGRAAAGGSGASAVGRRAAAASPARGEGRRLPRGAARGRRAPPRGARAAREA